jgi:hypothetical protein
MPHQSKIPAAEVVLNANRTRRHSRQPHLDMEISCSFTKRLRSPEKVTHVHVMVEDSHRGGSPIRRRDIANPLVHLADHAFGNAHQSERLLVGEHIADLLVCPRSFQLGKDDGERDLAVAEEADLFFYFVRGCDPVGA